MAGLTLQDRLKSSDIQVDLRGEVLVLGFERRQLRWFEYLMRSPLAHLPVLVFRAHPSGRRPWGRLRSRWRDYISRLAWKCPGVPQDVLESG